MYNMVWTATGVGFIPKNKCENEGLNSEQMSVMSHANNWVV
jgi:hypothetical protein